MTLKRIQYVRDKSLWTDFNNFIRRNRRRFLVKQRPVVIWLTGLSGAGKTTIAEQINKAILRKGYFTKHFDGDEIRKGINSDLGYSEVDRRENIRRISEISRLFLDSGLVVICSFISPTSEMRLMAKNIIGQERFVEVFVNAPIEVCETRDAKGLYKMARAGLLKNFTGIDAVYEPPIKPDVELRTDLWDIPATTKYLMRKILPKIKFRKSWFRIN
jgi:adenylylsulfate kinase